MKKILCFVVLLFVLVGTFSFGQSDQNKKLMNSDKVELRNAILNPELFFYIYGPEDYVPRLTQGYDIYGQYLIARKQVFSNSLAVGTTSLISGQIEKSDLFPSNKENSEPKEKSPKDMIIFIGSIFVAWLILFVLPAFWKRLTR